MTSALTAAFLLSLEPRCVLFGRLEVKDVEEIQEWGQAEVRNICSNSVFDYVFAFRVMISEFLK